MEEVKLKLLIIGERFFPEEFLVNDVVKFLQVNNFNCQIITHQPSYGTGKIYEGYKNSLLSNDKYWDAKIYRISFLNGYKNNVLIKVINYFWFVFWGIYVVLFKIKETDKILIYQTGPLTQAIIGIVAKWKFKKNLYIWTWDIWPDSVFGYGFKRNIVTKSILNSFVKFVYRKCDHIWISSPGFREVISKFTNKECLEVPNWVIDSANFNQVDNVIFPNGFHFTFTGNVGKVQNLENVILGFHDAFKGKESIFLNIVGGGSNIDELKKLVAKYEVSNIIFWGIRPYSEMDFFYKNSHILLISLKNGSVWDLYLPSKFQSYLNAKVPIFGVIDGTVKSLIQENKLGVTSNPDDIKDISKGFLDCYNNQPSLKISVDKQADNVNKRYDQTNIKKLILEKLVT